MCHAETTTWVTVPLPVAHHSGIWIAMAMHATTGITAELCVHGCIFKGALCLLPDHHGAPIRDLPASLSGSHNMDHCAVVSGARSALMARRCMGPI